MSSKNVSLREDVYNELRSIKGDDESFSDVIERLMAAERGEHPLQAISGILDEAEAEDLREHVREFREDVDREMRSHDA